MGWRAALLYSAVGISLIRAAGISARLYRDSELLRIATALSNGLDQAGYVHFLDWGTLLGDVREKGVLWDDEDADIGVVLRESHTEEGLLTYVQGMFDASDYYVTMDPGRIFIQPKLQRIHVDLYLVRARQQSAGTVLLPQWDDPIRRDSHGASAHPRPFDGITTGSFGLPIPRNAAAYLESLYGFIGSPAKYEPSTGLYIPVPEEEQAWTWSSVVYPLTRDFYFIAIMLPVPEDVRQGMEDLARGLLQTAGRMICPGAGNLRDCFAS